MKYQILLTFNKYSIYNLLIILALLSTAYVLRLNERISTALATRGGTRTTNSSNNSTIVHDESSVAIVQHRQQDKSLLHYFSRYSQSAKTSTSTKVSSRNDEFIVNHEEANPFSYCQRYCPRRINKIYYADDPAGLSDRKVILRDLAQLAGFLCAEVIMPPPKEHLSADHNFGKPISDEIEWSDFINITFIQDGSTAIQSAKTLDDGINVTSWSNVPAFKLSGPEYKDWLHIVSTDGKMRDDFEVIQRFSFQQAQNATIGFVWEIHKKWYPSDLWLERLPVLDRKVLGKDNATHYDEYRKRMRPYLETYYGIHPKGKRLGCMYTDQASLPSQLAMMQKRLMKRIVRHSPNNTIFGNLHLRRGDAVNDCDTSVETMRRYFACSLENTETLGRNITMLMTTDEDDMSYRQGIMELIEDYPHVSILDADEIVRKVVREAAGSGIISKALDNNYYVFEVESVLRDWENTFFKFHLVRRRSTCRKCIKLFRALGHVIE